MTDLSLKIDSISPCGFGIFKDGDLLVAFPTEQMALEILRECEHDGHKTNSLTTHPIFPAAMDNERITALEAQLQETRTELTAAILCRDQLRTELRKLREQLQTVAP